jgi:RHS repeat-associated protein
MPAPLPPNVAYTYALEVGADEATTKINGKDVIFNQPVPFYVTNFLNFPVGETVPLGYYNGTNSAWIPSNSGKVIKILSVTGGKVDLDITGSGTAADTTALTALGITDAERIALVSKYAVGTSLWRVQLPHLSTWDCNWGFWPPDDAQPPTEEPNQDPKPDDQCQASGSTIGCESQTLGETIPLVGTDLKLHYNSDRVPGRIADGTINIPLSGATIPASLKRIEASIQVAGKSIDLGTFPAQANKNTTFTWDGKNTYGQIVQGMQPATVTIGYVYDGVYQQTSRFGYNGNGTAITGNRTRQEITLSRNFTTRVSVPDLHQVNVGGWSLDVHHVYDPLGKVLYQGDGTRRSTSGVANDIITTVAGNGFAGYDSSYDGGPAIQASLDPMGVAVSTDGSLYIADTRNHRIRRVAPDGIITTVAGNGRGFSGDGGPANQARLNSPTGVAVSTDSSLYIADYYNNRIRRVAPDGIITTVAGNGSSGFSGDGGPATQATLDYPVSVTVSTDGSLYIADYVISRIRRVAPDGIITTVAGGGTFGDGVPATQAGLYLPTSVAVSTDGNLYIADNQRISRVAPDGIISTIAGNGQWGFSGDGVPATQASVNPMGVAVAPDGSVLIGDMSNDRIRHVGPDGIITTIAGNGQRGFNGDGGLATQSGLDSPWSVSVAADGSVFFTDTANYRIRKVSPVLPVFNVGDIGIASTDGTQLYQFNSAGRHLRTVDSHTGTTLYTFGYDSIGRLISITDANNNITSIERDANGNPTTLVAPFGQRTTFTVDSNGYIAKVTNPAGTAYQMQYSADGLLTKFTDPRSNASQFVYDSLGRLQKDSNAAGGSQTLTRTETANGYLVTRTTALGRVTTYSVEDLPIGDRLRTITTPDDLTTQTLEGTNGSTKTTEPDGTVTESLDGPDPRFGMQAPITTSSKITSGGLTATVTNAATVSPANPTDPLTFDTLTTTSTINGRTATSVYTKATRRTEVTSAAGRKSYSITDVKGRIVEVGVTGIEPIFLTYNTRGHLTNLTQGSGAAAHTTTLNYNTAGYLATATDALQHSSSLDYDLAGRVLKQTLANSEQIQFGYDAKGNLTSLTPPSQPAHDFAYNTVDLTTNYTPPVVTNGGDTAYQYNADKQLTQVTRPDGGLLSYDYDTAGRLSKLTIPAGQYAYSYNTVGKLSDITAPGGITLSYAYNGALLTSATWSGGISGNVGFDYDNDFRIKAIQVNNANSIAYQYDADSLLTQAGELTLARSADNGLITGSTLGSVTDNYTYNNFGELNTYNAAYNSTALLHITYTRDVLGRITSKVETLNAGAAVTYDYGYDAIGQLVEVKRNGTVIASYVYDPNGNRLSKTTAGGIVTGTYDDQDRMLSYGTATYAYTANGELKTKISSGQSTTYDYDATGNLRSVTLPNGTQITYLIDGKNRRVGKKVNGNLVQGFLYQSQLQPIAELDANGAVTSRFVYANGINVPDYMQKGGVIYRIIKDHLGSPRLVVNTATGVAVQQMDYDEYGNVLTDTNPGFQPFGFAGGIYDLDTGLVRFGARDYEAESGRWMAKDPIGLGGGANIYVYVRNDPENLNDLTGLQPSVHRVKTKCNCIGYYESGGDLSSCKYKDHYPSLDNFRPLKEGETPEKGDTVRWPDHIGKVVDVEKGQPIIDSLVPVEDTHWDKIAHIFGLEATAVVGPLRENSLNNVAKYGTPTYYRPK